MGIFSLHGKMQLAAGFPASKWIFALVRYMSHFRPFWRVMLYICSASLVLALAPLAHAQNPISPSTDSLPEDATQFVRDTIHHELEADAADHSHWRYLIHREDEKGTQDRDVIDTKDGQIARTLLINGQPLSPEVRAADHARMKKLVEDAAERKKREKRAKDDEDKLTEMLKAIPDAFIFKYDGAENGQVRLSFFPNPHYSPPNRELQVFRSLSGKMWIDRAGGRLTRMDGALFEDVTFGWGLLGRLNKGGTFSVTQSHIGENHWEVTALDVKMTGHAVIFKSINVKQVQRLTNFRRVRDDLTISEAYQLLEKDGHPVSAENQPSASRTPGKE
jgi:hypothetical protein